ncbi:MAG: UDP-N-acetylglucosamine 2-epimerase (non-hydrolyzing) [Legionellales bacterium]|nr:UDP-N-acetylglucosamine 2-epimerase (non-hydrolyzing) [Legionellales bacterium]|tara:strand:- start:6274 stop:7404 length:1131 start_codon:yes stop_codon:yes gene_type:complete
MSKMKVMTVVGTRPEIIRLSRVISKLDQYCDHTLVHTGQNYDYELNELFFQELGVRKPDIFLEAADRSPGSTIGQIMISMDHVFEAYQPDAMLVLGDTNSCLSVIVAKRRKIPIFHIEAGNRCFDQRVPEEINRRIVDHTADINLTYSAIARDYLLKEGLDADTVINVGSPMYEILKYYEEDILKSDALNKLNLNDREYFLVSSHREENIQSDHHFNRLLDLLEDLAVTYQRPIIVSTHPRTRKKMTAINRTSHPLIQFLKPLGFFDYIKLQMHAKAVLSDSGTLNEEASILNFPALQIRESFERPESMEEATVMMIGLDIERLHQSLHILEDQPRGDERLIQPVLAYQVKNFSDKVVRIIHTYTDYVNRVVWKVY